jgi:hypothetical protein
VDTEVNQDYIHPKYAFFKNYTPFSTDFSSKNPFYILIFGVQLLYYGYHFKFSTNTILELLYVALEKKISSVLFSQMEVKIMTLLGNVCEICLLLHVIVIKLIIRV